MLKEKAFTMLELIMIIVIIAILAAVAIPVFVNMRLDASNAAAEANIAALRSAAGIYYGQTGIDQFSCRCVVSGAVYNGTKGCNGYGRTTSVDNPCYPANTNELESLLSSNLTWPIANSSANCYNSGTGAYGPGYCS